MTGQAGNQNTAPGVHEEEIRVALVTGGGRGIGRAICVALARSGCNVAINYAQNDEGAQNTARLCMEASQKEGFAARRFVPLRGDIATVAGCEQLYENTAGSLGAPDILINNAGITRDNLLLRMSVEDFEAVIDINLRAAFILSKLAARSMAKKRAGRIISISSVVGLKGNAGQANYAASKAGIIGLTKALAKELGSRFVTVNAVAPGFIATDMTGELGDEAKDRLRNNLTIPRPGSPEDVANLVAFLAGDGAGYITGEVIAVDGGLVL